jgi:hypothetical protein
MITKTDKEYSKLWTENNPELFTADLLELLEQHQGDQWNALTDTARLDWMDKTCSIGEGMRLDYKVGGLRAAIDTACTACKNKVK